jgi:hypothetical protein
VSPASHPVLTGVDSAHLLIPVKRV